MRGIIILLTFFCVAASLPVRKAPRFEDYAVQVYSGRIHRPKWISHEGSGEWRDKLDKLVGSPEVNFAGKYFVAAHSCGTECRYYTMTDLSTGRELAILSDFNAAEPAPKTREGYTYIPILVTRPNSRLLVAQYDIDSPSSHECRERAFVLDGEKIRPITGTRRSCTQY